MATSTRSLRTSTRRRTVREALASALDALTAFPLPSPALDAEVLLAYLLGVRKEALYRDPDRLLTLRQYEAYRALIVRRAKREPVAYLVGSKEFYGRPFAVNRSVLIPRPETEDLIDAVRRRFHHSRAVTIADVGTGSGCIAITLAHCFRNAHLIATDLSPAALAVAHTNAVRHRVASRITFLQGSLLAPLADRPLDLIVANLPYVPEEEVLQNPDLAYEPLVALRGQRRPEETFAAFLRQWYAREDRPLTLLEIHPNQEEALRRENDKLNVEMTFERDLAGRTRIAVLQYHPVQVQG